MTNRHIARRTLLSGTGMGVLGAGFAASFNSGLRPAEAKAGPGSGVWSQGYVADKGDVRLAMYRKWLPPSPDNRLPVLFLVHGPRCRRGQLSISTFRAPTTR